MTLESKTYDLFSFQFVKTIFFISTDLKEPLKYNTDFKQEHNKGKIWIININSLLSHEQNMMIDDKIRGWIMATKLSKNQF